jgi:hypothetical protein
VVRRDELGLIAPQDAAQAPRCPIRERMTVVADPGRPAQERKLADGIAGRSVNRKAGGGVDDQYLVALPDPLPREIVYDLLGPTGRGQEGCTDDCYSHAPLIGGRRPSAALGTRVK